MPHGALKLASGVNTSETAAQNENAGVTQSNLVRYFYDANGLVLLQKLGGWTKYISTPMVAIVRALWAWEDLNLNANLAVGTQTVTATGSAQLAVITGGNTFDVTPTVAVDNITPGFASTAGSPVITITDNTTLSISSYNSVYIGTQVSIGGIVLFGTYACTAASQNTYTVNSVDQLGNLLPANATSSTAVLPQFTTTVGAGQDATVTVYLPNFTYAVGDTFAVLLSTTVGGITFNGNYVVQAITDANHFTILGPNAATSSATGTLNGGQVCLLYSFGQGALPLGQGYGAGGYGDGGYGIGIPYNPTIGTEIDAIDWTLDNFGQNLIACPIRATPTVGPVYQPIYAWTPGSAYATLITAAPPVNDGIFVAMPQRQIVAWGSTETGIQDPLLIQWCDVGNYNQWIALVTNQAGSYRIPKGSRIVGCVQGPQQALIWTDIDVWSMQYIGPPYVYSFNEIGTGCGLIARKAAAAVNGIFYWMGPSQFFTLSSTGVQTLPCPVWDVIFQNLDQNNLQKIRVAVNSRFNEIQWFYPSMSGETGEVDSYIKYNITLGLWDFGALARSAWVDQSVLGPPIGADPNSLYLYQHETSNDADGTAMLPSFQTGYFAVNEGDNKTFIDWIWPDMKWGMYSQAQSATVQISFLVADYPGQNPVVYGPYSVTQATEYFYTRFRARLMAIQISSSDLGSFWRIGLLRYRFSVDGRI
jgi:hypothetical protein